MEKSLILKQVPAIVSECEALEIVSKESMEVGVEILSRLNQKSDAIEEEKAKVMRPLLDAQAAERARWKPTETILAQAILTLRKKISAYQTATKAKEEEEKAKIAARIGEGKGHLTFETALKKTNEVEVAEEKVATESGSVGFRTDKMFKIVDLKELPIEFHIADETGIRKAMKAGKELPGVKYWTEQVPINRR